MLAKIKRMDWVLNSAVLLLSFSGLLTIYSISPQLFFQQLIWFILGIIIILLFIQIDWRPLINYRWIVFGIYGAALFLLLLTYFFAPTIRGTRGWLVIGPAQIQPVEFIKIALVIVYAYFFSKRHVGIARWQNVFIPFVYFILPAVLVMVQPDLGSALILFGLFTGFLFVSGIRWRQLAVGFFILILLAIWGWNGFLGNYQKERIIGLFNPAYDPLGVNYSVIQSKISVGSAGLWGKGYQQGTQTQLGFLPEAATDFIFSAFTEEWGLAGAVILLGLFALLMIRIIKIGLLAENNFYRLITLGATVLFLLHFSFNIGSGLGLLPVIGVPFPFFSYGGSNFLANAILVGIVQSIAIRFGS